MLAPIDEAIVATHGDVGKRKELEGRLVAALTPDLPLDATQFVCRKLMLIGTSAAVPTLAAMLADKQRSHMARYALERITGSEAAAALREAIPKLAGALKAGMISSLGSRQDAASVAALGALLQDSDTVVARAAAQALGAIRSPEAAKAMAGSKPAAEVKPAVVDASFACAESLLAAGKNAEALSIYKGLAAGDPPKHVKLAATRGMLACASKK